ncbi:hypothetical protein [Oscillatoria acuminata]|uniref:Uncharacterized protein n=1 Tax=Oscillatoria acuminata PCC 6304 TaxID=56110 RepID=K9TU56_9CYAN|nr:hypothetical protein [Oscillatoria acuminata]AFY85539.1 hypothetical protein Oscil6304_6084 [Oscillatoria acuminata PCC 6304]
MKINSRHPKLKAIAANPNALPQGNLTPHLESELSRAALTTPTKTMKITTSSYLWRNYSIFVNPFDGIFHAIATTPTGKLQRVAASPDRAIAAIQMDLLWTTIFHSESPG